MPGGLILPGPALALRALGAFTGQLPEIDYTSLDTPFPDSFDRTELAMVLGSSLGAVGAVRAAVAFLEETVGRRLPKFITGGAGAVLTAKLPASWRFDPYLVEKGLYALWEVNSAG